MKIFTEVEIGLIITLVSLVVYEYKTFKDSIYKLLDELKQDIKELKKDKT